jgi:hypothetical protein
MKLLGWSIIEASCCGVVDKDTQPPPATGEQNVECAGAMLRSMLWRSENIWGAHGVSVSRDQRARSGGCNGTSCAINAYLAVSKSDSPVFFCFFAFYPVLSQSWTIAVCRRHRTAARARFCAPLTGCGMEGRHGEGSGDLAVGAALQRSSETNPDIDVPLFNFLNPIVKNFK